MFGDHGHATRHSTNTISPRHKEGWRQCTQGGRGQSLLFFIRRGVYHSRINPRVNDQSASRSIVQQGETPSSCAMPRKTSPVTGLGRKVVQPFKPLSKAS